jgi:hypothetical protein
LTGFPGRKPIPKVKTMQKQRIVSLFRLPGWLWSRAACQALGLALMLALTGSVQIAPQQTKPRLPPPPLPNLTSPPASAIHQSDDTDIRETIEADQQLRALNDARQKSMVADAARLLKLAGGTLTPAELRKVAEIEKLAHNVKEKMSYPVTGMQASR